ncbi:MAG: DUF362 domain-containing protein [Christensenellaceae bacterium]|nr:DUF362 domain-containing protein [Christensenellaceae bacterium]
MEKAKVYFSNMRIDQEGSNDNLLKKLGRLMRAAGIADIDFEEKMVAIKLHFGEPGGLAFLRPNYAKAVADVVKELGGHPFLTDCNTLYVGRRTNAIDHLGSAAENGFSPLSTGCHVIIGDGLKGTDDIAVPVPGGELCKQAYIGRAIMDADIFISLNHCKGHEMAGFGGALKNIGMGCGSRAGKMDQHSDGKPFVNPDLCRGCKRCARECAQDAISYGEDRKAVIDQAKCVGCGRCIGACNFNAIDHLDDSATVDLSKKITEYSAAVLHGRPHFHVSLAIDISPYCDCYASNDAPVVPDVGMFASFDPVALDQACIDAINKMTPFEDSILGEHMHAEGFCDHHEHFRNISPESEWEAGLIHAEKIGLGTREYELITVK